MKNKRNVTDHGGKNKLDNRNFIFFDDLDLNSKGAVFNGR